MTNFPSPYFPRSEVLSPLTDMLKTISPTVFLTSRPSVVAEQLKDYIVLKLPNGLRDRADTYLTGLAHIYLFARDRDGGIENAWKLDRMMNALCALCPIVHPRFTADRPLYLGGSGDAGFHFIRMQISLTINKCDLSTPEVPEETEPEETEEPDPDATS